MAIKIESNGKMFVTNKQPETTTNGYASAGFTPKPGFIVRWGLLVCAGVILLLLMGSWLIKFPETLTSSAKLTSVNAPKPVVCNNTGKLVRLFVKEGDLKKQGDVLGYIESLANYEDVLRLSAVTDSLQHTAGKTNWQQTSLYSFFDTPLHNLGELQQAFQIFQQSLISYRDYISNGFYPRKINMLSNDMAYLQKMHANLLQQRALNEQDLDLTQKTFNDNQTLKNDKIISEFDYRIEKSKLISKQLSLPQINGSILNNESQQNEKRKEIMELENQIARQKYIFIQALNTFKSEIDEWKKKYLLICPVNGKIAFAAFFQEGQQVQTNQIVCYINTGNMHYYAEVYVPQENLGKLKTGQEVLLKFDSYPFPEYGMVIGKTEFISDIFTDSGYLVRVELPNGLTTTQNMKIQYKEGLTANAEIILQNMRLLERFYYKEISPVIKH